MKTMRIGIASYEQMKARTMAIARGEYRAAPSEPKVWFTSVESVAKVLSAGRPAVLEILAQRLEPHGESRGSADTESNKLT